MEAQPAVPQGDLPDLFGSLLGTGQFNFFHDFLLVRHSGCRSASTPWHGTQTINCWIALDDITFETALRFVRGSHRTGEVFRSVHFDPDRTYGGPMEERRLPPDFDRDGEAATVFPGYRPAVRTG